MRENNLSHTGQAPENPPSESDIKSEINLLREHLERSQFSILVSSAIDFRLRNLYDQLEDDEQLNAYQIKELESFVNTLQEDKRNHSFTTHVRNAVRFRVDYLEDLLGEFQQ